MPAGKKHEKNVSTSNAQGARETTATRVIFYYSFHAFAVRIPAADYNYMI